LIKSGRLQAKLKVSHPSDPYEQEADRVAEQVVNNNVSFSFPKFTNNNSNGTNKKINRKCDACSMENNLKDEEEKDLKISMKRTNNGGRTELSDSHSTAINSILSEIGKPLDRQTRDYMEPRFGYDFSNVRIHSDRDAVSRSSESVNALAFTVDNNIVFGNGKYNPNTKEGKRLLAHELTHVIQQTGESKYTSNFSLLQRQITEPESLLDRMNREIQELDELLFGKDGGSSGGGGSSDSWEYNPDAGEPSDSSTAPAAGAPIPSPTLPSIESSQKKMNFYHGTTWTIAKSIPKNVKPIGGGDFASGFYTHYDEDNFKALARAITWGKRIANQMREPFAGVIQFGVKESDYSDLFKDGKGKKFNLKNKDQPDYKTKQRDWLNFVTTYGREKNPAYNQKRNEWIHGRRKPQPKLNYNIIEGPFYRGVKGKEKDGSPKAEEFEPYMERGQKQIPQQIVWANEGVDLLNSDKVETQLSQYDVKTGKRQDPVIDYNSIATFDIDKITEETQMDLNQ
jgi:hypothetical protein